MRLSRLAPIFFLLFLVVAGSASATPLGRTATQAVAVTAAPAFTPDELAATPMENWINNGGANNNQRYSGLDQINTSNVANLKEAWHIHLDGSGMAAKYSAEGTPIVYNGVMYIPTGNSDVFAVDATNGQRIWTHLSGMEQTINTACCGWDNRGVSIGDGKIFVSQLDGQLVALDQAT